MSKYYEPRKIQLWNTKHFVKEDEDEKQGGKKKKIVQQISKNSVNIFVY
jgi:hypothetical protein